MFSVRVEISSKVNVRAELVRVRVRDRVRVRSRVRIRAKLVRVECHLS